MKKIIIQILTAIAVFYSWQQVTAQPFPDWIAKVSLTDESDRPLAGAHIQILFPAPSAAGQTQIADKISGATDTYGKFSATHKYTSSSLDFRAEKSGYYPTVRTYELGFSYDSVKWNPNIKLVLKSVVQPIPMYAKWVRQGPPIFNRPVGFDLTAGDWVVPNGKGQKTDIIFTQMRDEKSAVDYEYSLKVAFPNKGDGIQEFTVSPEVSGSALKSPHEAPENGYQPEVIRANVSHPPEAAKMDYDAHRNYFFRVRTVLDEHGNIKSALYGKIYGDFMQFRYYLNPTPNGRNIEFDPLQNLLHGQNVPEP